MKFYRKIVKFRREIMKIRNLESRKRIFYAGNTRAGGQAHGGDLLREERAEPAGAAPAPPTLATDAIWIFGGRLCLEIELVPEHSFRDFHEQNHRFRPLSAVQPVF